MAKTAMQLHVEIISRETIKPSTPTPPHHRIYSLSFLDHMNPRAFVPVLYFYTHDQGSGTTSPSNFVRDKYSNQLKKSLSETLVKYYPFSGRIRDRVSIDCNDDGAMFVQARIKNIKLSEILENPKDEVLDLLFVDGLHWKVSNSISSLLLVQESFFDCGGMAIGVCLNHKLAGTTTMIKFMNDWAAIARNEDHCVQSPELDAASIFPVGDLPTIQEAVDHEWKHVSKRFVFDASKVTVLKAMVTNKLVQNPTRTEVVTALIHKCCISALRSCSSTNSSTSTNPTLLLQSVDLRARVVPPLPESSVGNMVWFFPVSTAEESEPELHDLVAQMKERRAQFFDSYAKRFRGEQWPSLIIECKQKAEELLSKENQIVYTCSSWCRFPLYEADFGWGKPIWVTIPSYKFKHNIFLLDTRGGDGIEAFVNLEEQHMAVFERDAELLAFASLNPSVV